MQKTLSFLFDLIYIVNTWSENGLSNLMEFSDQTARIDFEFFQGRSQILLLPQKACMVNAGFVVKEDAVGQGVDNFRGRQLFRGDAVEQLRDDRLCALLGELDVEEGMLEEGDGLKVLVRSRLHEEHDLRRFEIYFKNWKKKTYSTYIKYELP